MDQPHVLKVTIRDLVEIAALIAGAGAWLVVVGRWIGSLAERVTEGHDEILRRLDELERKVEDHRQRYP